MGQIACTAWGILTMRAYVVKALARRWNRDPFWFIARDAAGKRRRKVRDARDRSRPGVELIRHGRALDDVVRGGGLVHVA